MAWRKPSPSPCMEICMILESRIKSSNNVELAEIAAKSQNFSNGPVPREVYWGATPVAMWKGAQIK
jgi:hypothetical protein